MYERFKACHVDQALQRALLTHFDGDQAVAAARAMGAAAPGALKKYTTVYWHAVALGVALAEAGVAPATVLGL